MLIFKKILIPILLNVRESVDTFLDCKHLGVV